MIKEKMNKESRNAGKESSFIGRAFSEPDGCPSFSRLATAIIVLTLLSWDTYLVLTKGAVPSLSDQALFAGVLYASNKAATTVTSVFEKK